MLLVDSSIWIDHLRQADPSLLTLLAADDALVHPAIIGEIAMGGLRDRRRVIADLRLLPRAEIASDVEVLDLVERHSLFGRGLGWIDAHLLAATLLTPGARLWTRDKRLGRAAADLGVAP